MTDQTLLREYAERRSEAAFAEFVRRHVDLVYSAAVRMVRDAHLAEDVTQSVFLALAQDAPQLTGRAVLSGWLHRTAQNLAAKAVRSDARRRAREQEAAVMNQLLAAESEPGWEHIVPHLDAALGELSEPDRDVVMLRYFERKSAREMAQVLQVSDEAAQKRVNRAVERLREFFARRGVAVGASGLVALVSANAVQAAPAGLAATISAAAALTGTTIVTTATAAKTIVMTTLQKAVITGAIAIALGTGVYEARQASRLRDQVQTLQQHQASLAEQIQQLQKERDAATRQLAALREENERLNRTSAELPKLRGEVGVLRNVAREAKQAYADPSLQAALEWKARASKLRARLDQMPDQKIPQLQLLSEEDWLNVTKRSKLDTELEFRQVLGLLRDRARKNIEGAMFLALNQYKKANNGQLPADMLQLKPYFNSPVDDAILLHYEIQRSENADQWRIVEKEHLDGGFDTTFRIERDVFGVVKRGSLDDARSAFYSATGEKEELTNPAQLLPYVKTPEGQALLDSLIQSSAAR